MTIFRAVLCSLAVLVLSGPVPANSRFDASGPRIDQVDIEVLLVRAEQGDARAAFLLGTRYAAGRSAVRDDSQALRWFQVAADQGLAEAQYNLGIMYLGGRGTVKDLKQAAAWMQLAAEQGLARAQYRLGVMYATGEGFEKQMGEALRWFTLAAEAGVPGAQYNAGLLLEYGQGTTVDLAAARRWYRLAADNGVQEAATRLAALESVRQPEPLPATTGTPAQISAGETPISPPSAVAAPSGHEGSAWIRQQDPKYYTVQILVSENTDALERYIDKHGLTGRVMVVPTLRDGSPAYTLVYGAYPSYAEAVAVLPSLPEKVRAGGAFARRIQILLDRMPAE